MRPQPSLLENLSAYALFLDFDGTLADIAPKPWLVRIDPETIATITHLQIRLGGALAVVSGRQVEDLDTLLGVANLSAAGIHGAQVRRDGGPVIMQGPLLGELDALESALRRHLGDTPDILIERKPVSIALHYRGAPWREEALRALARDVTGPASPLRRLHGKMVIEWLPHGADKGKAIAGFMACAPFAGRIPVFAGDDVTDEDAHNAVNALGGISIKIGNGASAAYYGFETGAAFRAWLQRTVRGEN